LPNLGLPTAVYEKISHEVDVIQHVASHTSWVLPYEKMRANVASTLEIIKFATTHKTKRINYTSSKAMFGSFDIPAKSDIAESVVLEDIQNVVSGYGQSKWVMECLFRKARTLGLPVNLLHLGFITPHSKIKSEAGETFLTNFIIANAVHGISTLHDYNINPLPVDFVVDVLIKLGEDMTSETKTYHFGNPEASYWQEVANFIQANTRFQMKFVTDSEWLAYIYAHIKDTHIRKIMPMFKKFPFFDKPLMGFDITKQTENLNYLTNNGDEAQAKYNISCPKLFSDGLLLHYMRSIL
jgi:thioester reductase-like protein